MRSTRNWSQGLLSVAAAADESPSVTGSPAAARERLRDATPFNEEALLSSLRAHHAVATRTGAASSSCFAAATAVSVDDGSSTPNIAAVKGAGADAASCGLTGGRTEEGGRRRGDGSRLGDGDGSRFDDDDDSRRGDGDGSRRGDADGCRRGDGPGDAAAVGTGVAVEAGCFRGDSSAKAAASNASIWSPFSMNPSPPLPPLLRLLLPLLLSPTLSPFLGLGVVKYGCASRSAAAALSGDASNAAADRAKPAPRSRALVGRGEVSSLAGWPGPNPMEAAV